MTLRASQSERGLAALSAFYASDLAQELDRHRRVDATAELLSFVRGVIDDVPAYRKFLGSHQLEASALRTLVFFPEERRAAA